MVFDHALSFQGEGKKLTNEWVLTSPRTIEIRQGAVTGWTRESYRDPSSGEGQPLLLPWGGVKTSKYVFDGHHFEPSPETRAALAASPLPGHAGPSTGTSASPSGGVPLSPLPPVLKKGGDLSAEVLAQFRQDHQVAVEVIPKADFQTNLAEDARLERVVLLGKDLVVCGPGFLGGRSYVFAGTPFADAEDIQSVTAMDFAGNGTFQLIVRGVRHTPMKGSTEAAHTDLMVIYAFQGTTLERVLTVETGREWGKKRIQGLAQFIPLGPGRGVELDVQAGRANGWTASTYPWTPSDVDNTDNLVPLLLPWGSVKSMRYAWSGSHFVRK
jgi:hypothetical protein